MNEIQRLRARVLQAELDASALQRPRHPREDEEMNNAAARHDAVAAITGRHRARAPKIGETPLEYRKALAGNLQKESHRFANVNLGLLDATSFGAIETLVYSDAEISALRSARGRTGQLVPIQRRDESGRLITEYHGDIMAAFGTFVQAGARCKLNTKGQ